MSERARPKLNRTELEREATEISRFVADSLVPIFGAGVAISEVFGCYQEWRGKAGLEASVISPDSFGKLLPSFLERRRMYHKGKQHRAIWGVKLR
jgi:hypothetical protein